MTRSIADQTDGELGGRWSVLSRQRADHVRLDRLLRRLEGTTGAEQEAVLLRIHRLVFPHAFAEEAVLWPVMRRTLPDGEGLTLAVEQEHQEVNELVTRLERLEHGDPERTAVVRRLVEVLREDVRDEEDVLLPRLQAALDPAQLRRLGVAWEAVRRTAPTRAHPVVARRPPGNVLAALPLSVLDRARDLVAVGSRRAPSRAVPALHAAEAGLRRAAHGVERVPFLRIGEDPSTRSDRPDRAA